MLCEAASRDQAALRERTGAVNPPVEDTPGAGRAVMTVHFPRGVPGFPGSRDYELVAPPDAAGPFLVLRGCAREAPSFVTVAVEQPDRLFDPAEMDEAVAALGGSSRDLLVLLMVGGGDGEELHVNMRAPVFIDVHTRSGAQIVLSTPRHPLRAPLRPGA
ncbi:flagellar assembly protein FliW [Marinimicrococcus flavescens]|uniref:Flagellar assembly protein FliW n=1 Tax=Marinimicrococcus flavescens TaxID=3031815 RepID=A0AAP4D5W1_9PROT|nr:flagellar assembly protein FliW [Marinimicrococcus flavescens]